ncbi:DoxX family protein [Motiliproteus sediminis]|uniref:DoxX family protein n=1 Tax=Motiliproteus sediminis TaxID=1468178 RepID=UPI001AEFCA8A|nr:DoxX family protein [Motiliproteus sediminis]
MKSRFALFAGYYWRVSQLLNYLQPLGLLAARLYIAKVFFFAGLTKLQDWDTTLFLFEEEYSVPLLPFELAAWLGTAGEILLPVLLVLGLTTRFGALGLSVVNVVAVISLEEIAPAALTLHLLWGVLLAQLVIWGAGRLSVDGWFKTRWQQPAGTRPWGLAWNH